MVIIALPLSAMADKKGKGGKFWKGLTDKQRSEIMSLKLNYTKKKLLIKAKMKQAKIEMATLMTSDSPNRSAINKKIDALLALKKQALGAKVDFKLAVRKLLTKEQQVGFDMKLLKHMAKGKKGCNRGRGYHRGGGYHHGRGYGMGRYHMMGQGRYHMMGQGK